MIQKHIPNFFTCCNIFCGCMGVVQVNENQLINAVIFIFIGMLFDFADGLAARLLQAYSEIGTQLDSLADMLTFGLLPSLIIFNLWDKSYGFWAYSSFLIAIFSALRLAKFNIDTRQKDSFVGLPTPANALFITSLPLISWQYPHFQVFINHFYFLSGFALVSSYLLVAEVSLFSLKFKNFSFEKNRIRYSFLFLSLILFVILQSLAIPLVIGLYLILSILTEKK